MTEEERNRMVGHIEKMIREFRIEVSGGAYVDGRFGHLPQSDDLETRISNIERSVDNFNLTGEGVEVSGNFEQGFILS